MKSSTLLSTVRVIGAVMAITACFVLSANADTIKLKDGSVIKGKITSYENGRFTIVVGEGERRRQLSYEASEIESIIFDDSRTATPSQPSQKNPAPPAAVRVVVSENLPADGTAGRAQKSDAQPPVSSPNATSKSEPSAKARGEATVKPNSQTTGKTVQPITVRVSVLADNTHNGWTNSGWVVRKGQKIRISGSGEIDLGGGKKCPPGGLPELEDSEKLLKAVPTGALIAVIGDDNNEFIYIGDEREFIAARDGALFLGVNEGKIDDNSGTFQAVIEIWPK